MKNYAITSGKFTGAGNFTGYTALGERVHVHKAQMASLKWAKDEEVKFPFYAIGEVKKIGQLNEDNSPKTNEDGSPVLVDRLTATSVFSAKQGLIEARVDAMTLDIDITKSVKEAATKAGLTEKELSALVVF
jgi:hypothetical protein